MGGTGPPSFCENKSLYPTVSTLSLPMVFWNNLIGNRRIGEKVLIHKMGFGETVQKFEMIRNRSDNPFESRD